MMAARAFSAKWPPPPSHHRPGSPAGLRPSIDAVFPSYKPATFFRFGSRRHADIEQSQRGLECDGTWRRGRPSRSPMGYQANRATTMRALRLLRLSRDGRDGQHARESHDSRASGRNDHASGNHTRGLWGLFGGYDYISPQVFRVSSTAPRWAPWQTWLGRRRVAGDRTGRRRIWWCGRQHSTPGGNETITTA